MESFDWISSNKWRFRLGDGDRIRFWSDLWCGTAALALSHPIMYGLITNKQEFVAELWDCPAGQGSWSFSFLRAFDDWKFAKAESL